MFIFCNHYLSKFFCTLSVCILFHTQALAQFELDVETGAVFSGYNKIQVPGGDGTRFSLGENYETDGRFFYRLRLLYTLNEKHTFTALFAPLDIRSVGNPASAIRFRDAVFPSSEELDVLYEFNSYRLTYRYLFPRKGDFQFGVGATAKIRDARIQLSNDDQSAVKKNVGFVPLINFRVEWFAKERLSLLLQGDALASPQGRAEDVLLAAIFYPGRNLSLKAGYRILEGGADNEELYNFTLIHYALIGGIYRF